MTKRFTIFFLAPIHLLVAIILFYFPHTRLASANIHADYSLFNGFVFYLHLEGADIIEKILSVGYLSIFILPISFIVFISKKYSLMVHLFIILSCLISLVHFYGFRLLFAKKALFFPHEYQHTIIFYGIISGLLYSLTLSTIRIIRSKKEKR